MGRKKLDNKPTVVRLPEDTLARIDEHVGTYGRAEFIRDAVERELRRRERAKERESVEPTETKTTGAPW